MEPQKEQKKFNLYIISHTHWDREWYHSFEHFRLLLLDVIDHTLDTLEKDNRFRAFHFDGQTSLAIDYLEIKPQERARLIKLARQNRLLIGPFYIQNDHFLNSGESFIRNLLMGHRDCESLRIKPMKVGYILDQFGQCSQTPQILRGFGIKWVTFARGKYNGVEGKDSFYWISPDGSRCLTHFLSQWYNNFQRIPEDLDTSLKLLNSIIEFQKNRAIGNSILLMNGVDHLDIQQEIPDLLEKIRQSGFPHNLIHSTITEFFSTLEGEAKEKHLKLSYKGELRDGNDDSILSGTLSSRIYLKQTNSHLSKIIEHYLEPICSLASLVDQKFYPDDSLHYLWRVFLQNHPHDSITGCSIDETHFQMVSRFHRINDISKFLIRRSGEFLANQITFEPEKNPDANQILLVYNPTTHWRDETVEFTLEMLNLETESEWFQPVIYPMNQKDEQLTTKILSIDKGLRLIDFPNRLPNCFPVQQYKMVVHFPKIPPLGYKSFVVRKGDKLEPLIFGIRELSPADANMENEFLRVVIHSNGTFDIFDKKSGTIFENLHFFEDSGDAGHEYVYEAPKKNNIITSRNLNAKIFKIDSDALRQTFKIRLTLNIPDGIDFVENCRKTFTISYDIETILTLKSNSPILEIQTRFNNLAENHRLRVGFPINLSGELRCFAESPFDVIDRTRGEDEKPNCAGYPNSGFVDVRNPEKGIALFCDGLPEYFFEQGNNTLYLTLLRAIGDMSHEHPDFKGRIIDFKTPDAQCIGELICRYSIFPHSGEAPFGEIKKICDLYLNPPEIFSSHLNLKELFEKSRRPELPHNYYEPPFEKLIPFERHLPLEKSLLTIDNPAIVFSAFKKAERQRDFYVCRLFNITDKPQKTTLKFPSSIAEIYEANLNEKPAKRLSFNDDEIKISLKPKKIYTALIKFLFQ